MQKSHSHLSSSDAPAETPPSALPTLHLVVQNRSDAPPSFGEVITIGGDVIFEATGVARGAAVDSHGHYAAMLPVTIGAVAHLLALGYYRVRVWCPYEGLAAWSHGRWKARSPIVAGYLRALRTLGVAVDFLDAPADADAARLAFELARRD